MNVHSFTSRAAAAIAAAALLVCTSMAPAQAATTAKAASVTNVVASGTWGATATLSTTAPYGTGPLTLTFPNTGSPGQPTFAPQYFAIGNTGSLTLRQAGYTGTADAPSTVQFIVETCSGGWDQQGGCPGTVSTVFAAQGGSPAVPAISATVPANPGTSIRLRARVVTSGLVPAKSTSALTIGVTVDRTQARAATTTSG